MRRALVALTVLLAACSGDGADPEATPPSTSTTVAPETTTTEAATTTTTEPRPPSDVPAVEEVTGPVTGGTRGVPYNPAPPELLTDAGYVEEEFFVGGTARSFVPVGELTVDGAWTVQPDATAPYTTRVIVRRPEDPADFNGVVLVEWLNVTIGRDSDPDWGFLHPYLLREGYVYVGVSAQQVGIVGGGGLEIPGVPPEAVAALQVWDPERYGSLAHPGDAFSYDLFSQIGGLVREGGDVLGGLVPTHVLAAGESQSAGRMVTYVDAVHPLARIYDGFLVHSRGGSAASLGEGIQVPSGVRIRTDLEEPVLVFETETDFSFLGFGPARQPDTDRVATWEVAGTAHADQSTLDYGIESGRVWADAATSALDLSGLCGLANIGPQRHVARATVEALRVWAVDGSAPPAAPPLELDPAGAIVRDADGNALGGIRTPDVDAPISTLTGTGSDASVFCSLFGATIPFTPERLAALYADHDAYVAAFTSTADAAVEAGFLLAPERDELVARAEAAAVPS